MAGAQERVVPVVDGLGSEVLLQLVRTTRLGQYKVGVPQYAS